MAWQLGIDLAELQQKERQTTTINGKKILFLWHKEQIHAIQAQCPHFKLPLSKGKLSDNCTIICPFHKSEFDLTTGDIKCWSPWPPAIGNLLGKISQPKPLKIYPTRIEQDKVYIDID